MSASAQTNVEGTLLHQGLERLYVVHIPPSYDGSREVPVVFVLHGGSGSAQNVQVFTRMNPVSNDEGFLAVYPQGYASTSIGGFAWADGRGTIADDQGIDDVGFLVALIDRIADDYAVAVDSVYLSGFSNGGFMTQRIACENNAPFAAMASLGSSQAVTLHPNCTPGRPVPMMVINGTADAFVPYDGGPMSGGVPDIISTSDLLQFWAETNGCTTPTDTLALPNIVLDDNSTVTAFGFTDCNVGADVSHLRINGGGHTWPGVELPRQEPTLGETNEDIDGSRELWEFFSQHQRNTVGTSMEAANAAMSVTLTGASPNPFSRGVQVAFTLADTRSVRLDVYDALGRHVSSVATALPPGAHTVEFDSASWAPGPYFFRLRAGNEAVTRTLSRVP